MVGDQYDEGSLRAAGFSDAEIQADKADVGSHLKAAGFSDSEVGQYMGQPAEPDMKPVQKYLAQNLADAKAQATPDGAQPAAGGPTPQPDQHPAEGLLDAFGAGWQMSVQGLIKRHSLPDTVLPENAGMAMRIAQTAGTLAGDVPAMLAGGVVGSAVGSAVPGVGTALGAAGGAWAAPAALRSLYIAHLQKGDIQDFGDLFARATGAGWEALKAGTTGILTEGVGGLAAGALARTAAPLALQTAGKLSAELGTMTTVGKAMEGQMPKPEDFVEGALLLGALHGVVHVASEMPLPVKGIQAKLQDIYAATGLKPEQVVEQVQSDPVLKQEMLSTDAGIPPSLKPMAEPPQPNQELLVPPKPEKMEAQIPAELNQPSGVLSDGFYPENKYEVDKPEEEPAPEPPKSEAAAGSGDEPPTPLQQVLDRIGEPASPKKFTWNDFYTRVFDSLNPIAQLRDAITGKGELPTTEDPYALQRLANASTSIADSVVRSGPIDFETRERTGTPGLQQILKPFKNDMDGLKGYSMSRRAIELEGRGIETGFPMDAAKQLVEEGKGKYEEAFQQLVDFQNDNLKYLKDAGVLSEEQHAKILSENPSYLPFNRVLEDGSAGGGRGRSNPIKAIEGSNLQLVDPFEQIVKNTFGFMKIAEENRAKLTLVDLAAKTEGGSDLVQKVQPTSTPIEVTPEELHKYLANQGIEVTDPESLTVWRKMAEPLAKDEIAVMRDGKREVYNVGEDVATAMSATGYTAPNAIMKIASFPAKLIRTGAVDVPDFLLRHLLRDQVNSSIFSENGIKPVLSAIEGLKLYFQKGELYQDWRASGGGMANVTELDDNYLQKDIFGLSKQTGLIDKAMNVVKTPFELMKVAADAIVSAPRLAEFKAAREAGKDITTSAYDSRNVTIDNQRMGAGPEVKAISMITAFWNTRLQGMDRMVQAFTDDPVRTASRAALAITLPSVLLWMKNKDDPRYQDLPRWQKDLFWIIPTDKWEPAQPGEDVSARPQGSVRLNSNGETEVNNGTIYRIPKPFEQGILFGSLPERMLDAFYAHNPDAFKGFGSALLGGALPNPIPNGAMAPIEQFANRSWMTGGKIVPHSLENVAPEYQYTPYTSESAKQIGKMIAMVPGLRDAGSGNITPASPMVVEHYVRAWGGSMGQYALQLGDKALEAAGVTPPQVKPTSTLSDMPIIKAFVVRNPSLGSQSIQDFYDNLEKSQTAAATMKHLAQTGDLKAQDHYMNSPAGQEGMLNLMGIEKGIAAQNRMIQTIWVNPDISPNDKRQQIDGLYYQMIGAAKLGNQVHQQMHESTNK